jgi:vanillate O-demethylase monooxygenase subunit
MVIDGVDMLPGRADFPRNAWYVGAFSHELGRQPIARKLFGDPVVMFRREDGTPVALFDRCPHKGMRLSNGGVLIGDNIQCGYHGIQFGPAGKCALIPSGGVPTSALSVRSYPVAEITGWIWIWAGDPALADESLIPDHAALGLTAEGFHAYFGERLDVGSNYLYSIENLVDATHITFLHHGMIDNGTAASHPYTIEAEGNRVTMVRVFKNEEVPPLMAAAAQLPEGRVNRTITLTSYAPNVCVVQTNYEMPDNPDMPGRDIRLVFGITPADLKSCYQFVAVAQTFENHYPHIFRDLRVLLMEDVVAMDDIQRLFDELGPDRVPEASVKSDEGAIRTRRLIAKQIAAERAGVRA